MKGPPQSITVFNPPPRRIRKVPLHVGPAPGSSESKNIYLKIRKSIAGGRTVYILGPHGEMRHQGFQDVLDFVFQDHQNTRDSPSRATVQVLWPYQRTAEDILTVEFVEYKYLFVFRLVNGIMHWYFAYLGNCDETLEHLKRIQELVRTHIFYECILFYTDSRNMRALQALLEYTGKKGRICPRWLVTDDDSKPHEHVVVRICTDKTLYDPDQAVRGGGWSTTHYVCEDTLCTALFKAMCTSEKMKFTLRMKWTDGTDDIHYWKGMKEPVKLTVMERMIRSGEGQPLWLVPSTAPIDGVDGNVYVLQEDLDEYDHLIFAGPPPAADDFLGFRYRQQHGFQETSTMSPQKYWKNRRPTTITHKELFIRPHTH
ncbi:uncharacterized protein LAJ45_04463 [Morchella importuna]|uniref:Uncharacterized protein n=1 Tax=Morchella conica CCBAS932 TaxID=1392247 RepID=A0A3N4KV24_9PEZI|nr:uncharacterized protein LAJ45_04463 [Morchella importuna]KAH8151261.1 hypothetical protein LAJ45_04463 [Morchella importuna]RPB14386.1 hypothetical protein P167DRAFT_572535 [Morchella conica CCBAS932]